MHRENLVVDEALRSGEMKAPKTLAEIDQKVKSSVESRSHTLSTLNQRFFHWLRLTLPVIRRAFCTANSWSEARGHLPSFLQRLERLS